MQHPSVWGSLLRGVDVDEDPPERIDQASADRAYRLWRAAQAAMNSRGVK
jgi:hypothetical protein